MSVVVLSKSANKSLERMPAEHGCFALSVVGGHCSAHRSRSGRTMMLQGDSSASTRRPMAVPLRVGNRLDGCVDWSSPCMCFPGATNSRFEVSAPGVLSSFSEHSETESRNAVSYRLHSRSKTHSSNQSLERTPVEQSCFALTVVCGRRSAHRSENEANRSV